MTRILGECPQCGRVELGVEDVTLFVSPHEGEAWYLFDCFGCAQRVVKPASTAVVLALSRVQVDVSIVPDEVRERRQPVEGRPPISTDDLLDLMLRLRACHHPGDLPAGIRSFEDDAGRLDVV